MCLFIVIELTLAFVAWLVPTRVETPVVASGTIQEQGGEPLRLRLAPALLAPERRREEHEHREELEPPEQDNLFVETAGAEEASLDDVVAAVKAAKAWPHTLLAGDIELERSGALLIGPGLSREAETLAASGTSPNCTRKVIFRSCRRSGVAAAMLAKLLPARPSTSPRSMARLMALPPP